MRTGVWSGYPSERGNLEDLDTEGKIILQWILKKQERDGFYGIYLAQDWRHVAVSCENCNDERQDLDRPSLCSSSPANGSHLSPDQNCVMNSFTLCIITRHIVTDDSLHPPGRPLTAVVLTDTIQSRRDTTETRFTYGINGIFILKKFRMGR